MKIEIEIDLTSPMEACAFATFVKELSIAKRGIDKITQVYAREENPQQCISSTEQEVPAPKTKSRAKKAESVEVTDAEEELPEAKESVKEEPQQAKEEKPTNVPTLMQIRALVAQKAPDHKEAIRAKLSEMGAQNVSTLDEKNYPAMHSFLEKL